MIYIGICEKNAGDRTIARRFSARLQSWCAFDLPRQIGRSID